MDKKKIIIVVVVFLLLGTMIYSFASGPSDQLEEPSGGNEQTEQPSDDQQEEEETSGDQEDDEQAQEQPSDDQTGTDDSTPVVGGETDNTNYLSIAEQAVAAAEESLTQADVDSAKEAIQNVIDNVEDADVSELVSKIENVENIIDFEALFKELEDMTNSSANLAELEAARNYNTTNKLTTRLDNLLAKLVENDTKTSLEDRYDAVLAKLNDTTAPSVDGIKNGEYTKEPVKLTITDSSAFTATLSKDGAEGTNYITGDEILENGKYTLTLVDDSFNEDVIEFVINNTNPVITLPTLKEDVFTNVGTINVTDDIEFEAEITKDGSVVDTVTATLQIDGTYLAALDLTGYGKGEYKLTATDLAENEVSSQTFDFDATGALATTEEELRTYLTDATIETIYLANSLEGLSERVVVSRPVTIEGNSNKLTFTDAINGKLYGERQGIVVTANDVVINDLTIEMDAVEGDDTWTGTYAIQVYGGSATLNNITATGADGGIFSNRSTVTLTGTIDVSGNEFGGIEVSNGTSTLNATEATIVNTTEAFKKPTIWTDKTPDAVVNVTGFTSSSTIKAEQVQYYLSDENIEAAEITTNVNDVYVSSDLNKPAAIYSNASASILVHKDYSNVRFRVENVTSPEGSNVRVWAMDTNGEIWDMITAGWGPANGFPVNAGYNVTTTFQIVADKAGSYSADIVLYDVTTGDVLSRQTISFDANILVTTETELSESLADSTIDTIYLPDNFTSTTNALDINRPVTIIGNGATLSNQVTISGDNVVLKDVVLTDDLTVTGENAVLDEVIIQGVTSTGTGNGNGHTVVKVDTTGDFTMTNSTIDNASSTGSFYNALNIQATGVVTIEGNTFTNMNNVYNVIEFSQDVVTANGTTIKGNKFDGANKNNIISMYMFEEGTVINIEDNEFAFSGNALRVSNYNNVNNVTFNISNNKYDGTLTGAYAGFMLFQEVKNESFSGITVNVSNLIGPSGNLVTADSTGEDKFCYYYFDHITNTGEATINFLD